MKVFSSIENRKIYVTSLAISLILWTFSILSEEYETEVTIPVTYENFPTNKVLTNNPPDSLYLYVKATGVDIFRHLKFNPTRVVVDYDRYITSLQVSTKIFRNQFKAQLPNIEINNISPDTIYFSLEEKMIKRVPVNFIYDITTANQFELNGVVELQPDSIGVTGPASIIDTLASWPTQKLTLRGINRNFSGDLFLEKSLIPSVTLSTDKIICSVMVEEFTEKSIAIAVEPVGLPPELNVFIYPKKVEVIFQVGINQFERISEDYFTLTADFTNTKLFESKEVPVVVNQYPIGVKNVRVEPKTIEFLILQ